MSDAAGQPGKSAAKKGRTALMLGGGAPNFPLMAGALLAFHKKGVKFDLISMTGAGSVLGLIYLAPKGLTQEQALENAVNYGIADALYAMLPINYKMFQKSGYRADRFREACDANPYLQRMMNQIGMNDADKLRSDAVQFMLAMMCPTDLNLYSTGLCAHAPFIEHVVDFAKLKEQPIDCVLNAYCIEDRKVREWRKDVIDVHHFRASLSFPFIYPPYRVDGKHYFEGAAYEALNLGGIGVDEDPNSLDLFPDNDDNPEHHHAHLDRVIVFNIMTRDLIKRPRNLWDAYGQSIILPLVANAQNEEKFIRIWQQYGHLFGPLKNVESGRADGRRPGTDRCGSVAAGPRQCAAGGRGPAGHHGGDATREAAAEDLRCELRHSRRSSGTDAGMEALQSGVPVQSRHSNRGSLRRRSSRAGRVSPAAISRLRESLQSSDWRQARPCPARLVVAACRGRG